MAILLENRLLEAAEQKIETNLTPQNRVDYMKIVVAGMKVALKGGPNSILASLKESKNPIPDCVSAAINLCLLMRKQSRGTMPEKAMVPAAMTLLLHALDFADKAGIVKIGNAELVQATHLFTNLILKRLGVTPQMIATATQKVHGITQDPQAMEKLKMKAGFVQHPLAPTPTPLPVAQPQGDDNGGV